MKAVTILNFGNFFAKLTAPCGLAIRLRKSMRSSGTPWLRRTSTAMSAEPPVYLVNVVSRYSSLRDLTTEQSNVGATQAERIMTGG